MVEEGEEITQEEGLKEETTKDKSREKLKFPWRIGVHQQTPEEA